MIQSSRLASSPARRFSNSGMSAAKRSGENGWLVIGNSTSTCQPFGRAILTPTATGRGLRRFRFAPLGFAHPQIKETESRIRCERRRDSRLVAVLLIIADRLLEAFEQIVGHRVQPAGFPGLGPGRQPAVVFDAQQRGFAGEVASGRLRGSAPAYLYWNENGVCAALVRRFSTKRSWLLSVPQTYLVALLTTSLLQSATRRSCTLPLRISKTRSLFDATNK